MGELKTNQCLEFLETNQRFEIIHFISKVVTFQVTLEY